MKKTLLVRSILFVMVALLVVSCKDDDGIQAERVYYDVVDYETSNEDKLTVTSSMPAYIFPYTYTNFGKSLVDRLVNKLPEVNMENIEDISTIVIHGSQIESLEDDFATIVIQLLLGKNVIIVEPTLDSFYYFSEFVTAVYQYLESIEEGREVLAHFETVNDVRQTFEAFFEISQDPNKLDDMFMVNSDTKGIIAEAIGIRGANFHIVERVNNNSETVLTARTVNSDTGEVTETVKEQEEKSSTVKERTPHENGLFADVLTEWINECDYYALQMDAIRTKSANDLNLRNEAQKYKLEDICTVQKVDYTMEAELPSQTLGGVLPVKLSFEVCAVYMNNADYYCVYKKIISYNDKLNCGPESEKEWRKVDGLGAYFPDFIKMEAYYDQIKFYGPYMSDIKSKSLKLLNKNLK